MMTAMQEALLKSRLITTKQLSTVVVVPKYLEQLVEELELLTKQLMGNHKPDVAMRLLLTEVMMCNNKVAAIQILIKSFKCRLQELDIS